MPTTWAGSWRWWSRDCARGPARLLRDRADPGGSAAAGHDRPGIFAHRVRQRPGRTVPDAVRPENPGAGAAARAGSTLAFRTISQTGIAYPNSPLSETLPGLPAGAPRAGDRFPWLRLELSADGPAEDLFAKIDDTRFTLIVIGQPAPPGGVPGLGDLLRTLVVPGDPANDRELDARADPTAGVLPSASGRSCRAGGGSPGGARRWRGTSPNGSDNSSRGGVPRGSFIKRV